MKCPKRIIIYVLFGISLVLLLMLILVLPVPLNKCKQIYLFHLLIYPGEEPDIPKDYSGIWYAWSESGTLKYYATIKDGTINGYKICFDSQGRIESQSYYNNGRECRIVSYYMNGLPKRSTEYDGLDEHGLSKVWNEKGELYHIMKYEHGVPIETIYKNDIISPPKGYPSSGNTYWEF